MKYEPYKALSFVPQALRVFRKKSLFFVRFLQQVFIEGVLCADSVPVAGDAKVSKQA